MGHRIHLLRHAKSSWDDPELGDHERPLAPRGVKATKAMRKHLGRIGLAPELVLCSSAARAVQTLEGVRDGLPAETEVEIEAGLYGAGPDELLARLRALSEEVGSVLLVGHNPAIEELALDLADGGDSAARGRMASKYPTGGLASLSFEGAWRDLGQGDASLTSFVVPKDLA